MPDNLFVGNYIKGKKIVESNATATHMNFFLEDGTYETAPIIDGEVRQEFDINVDDDTEDDELIEEEETDEIELVEESELGFYKTIQPIPYTDQDGNEIGVTEVGSIQEVPIALGDFWVAEGWAEKTDAPVPQTIAQKIGEGITGIFNKN
jgi:hypothetical protein